MGKQVRAAGIAPLKPMQVAAVIVHHDNPARLEEVVDSVCRQVAETIVVDVGTSPLHFEARLGAEVRLVRASNNGFGAGLLQGVDKTAAQALLLMNHDALLAPGAVSAMTETMSSCARVGAVGPVLWDEHSAKITSAGGTVDRHNFRLRHHVHPLSDDPYDVGWLDGAATLFRRSAYESVGGHDSRFFLYYEDADLCARLTSAGWRVMVNPLATCTHTISGGFHEMAVLRERNVLLFTEKAGGCSVALRRCLWTAGRIATGTICQHPTTGARARGLLHYLRRKWGPLA